jgi:DNA-binding CsgD family transcriptional regulator
MVLLLTLAAGARLLGDFSGVAKVLGCDLVAIEGGAMNTDLSERQIECLKLVANGVTSSKVIADRLGLAPSSVDNYLSRAARQLGVRGREEAALAFLAFRADLDEGGRQSSVQASVSRSSGLATRPEMLRLWLVAAVRWLLTVPPIGGGRHHLNWIEIIFSILKVAAVSLAIFATLALFGSGLVWLIGR